MMNQSSTETTAITTFVVRFWREPSADKTRWRGRAEHVESGQQQSFLEIEVLLGFSQRFGIGDAGSLAVETRR